MASYDDTAVVSGSVVSFADGADEVPCKSVKVTIPASLSGVSSVAEKQTGRNLFDKSTVTANTWIVVNDTTTESTVGFRTSGYIPVKANTKYFVTAKSSNRSAYYDRNKNGIAYFSFSGGASFNCLYDGYIRITIKDDIDLNTFIVNEGNEAIAYEPFGTTYTASLGRTIYGGEVDVVKGEGTDNCKKIALGDLTWIKSGTEGNFYCSQVTDIWYPSKGGISRYGIGVSDEFEFVQTTPADGQINAYFNTAYSGYRIFIKKTAYADRTSAEFKEYLQNINAHLVYKVNEATETDFTFTGQEINSRLGYNAFWSEQGNTELTYYKSGYGFTSVTVHKETPDGEPVEQTAKFHRIVYGGTADVVKGTCEPKNLFNEDWEVGGINDTTGLPNSETNKIRSKTFSSIKGGVTCYVGAPKNIRVLFYASDESFISETANIMNASFSVPANCSLFKIRGTVDYGTRYGDDIIICYGSSASEYVPHFEPFTFPPISMGTDEGENTLFANEGDSAITYRKAVD